MTRLRGLYAITDSGLLADGRLLPYCAAALRGGAKVLQYRDKSRDDERRLREADALRELCARHDALLIINDDTALAARLGVGLHLGQDDGSLAKARSLLPADTVIGATCHGSLALARQAAADGASYLAFGRFFDSLTKPGGPTAQPELLGQASALGLPTCVIGGITLARAPALIAAGASLVAVVNDLFAAPDAATVERRAAAFAGLFPT